MGHTKYRSEICHKNKEVVVGSVECTRCPDCTGVKHFGGLTVVRCLSKPDCSSYEKWVSSPEYEELMKDAPAEPADVTASPEQWAELVWWDTQHMSDVFQAGRNSVLRELNVLVKDMCDNKK